MVKPSRIRFNDSIAAYQEQNLGGCNWLNKINSRFQDQARSTIMAIPIPPPIHIEINPVL
jgi:hypothetical protein